jgi:hypothetical protein
MEITDHGMSRWITFFQDHNGVDGTFQELSLLSGDTCQPVNMIGTHHNGKRLLDSSEAVFEFLNGLFNARKVKTTHTTDRKDTSRIKQAGCLADGIQSFNLVSLIIGQGEFRAAGVAGNRLRMMAPAPGITVFLHAGRARGEFFH